MSWARLGTVVVRGAGAIALFAGVLTTTVAIGGSGPASAAIPGQGTPFDCTGDVIYNVSTTAADAGTTQSINSIVPSTGALSAVVAASGTEPNAIGMTQDGTDAWYLDETNSTTIYDYNTLTQVTTPYADEDRPGTVVAGAVDPANGFYYFASYASGTATIYGFDVVNHTAIPGVIATAPLAVTGGSANGDLAFDTLGNLYLVDSLGTEGGIAVVQGPLPTTAVNAQLTSTVLTTSLPGATGSAGFNGITFLANGQLVVQRLDTLDQSEIYVLNPNTGAVISGPTPLFGSGVDLASCTYNPTLIVQKDVIGGRYQPTDQFTMTVTGGGITMGNTATTTGTSTGIQSAQVGPLIGQLNATYSIAETAATGSTTNLLNYTTTYSCVDTNTGTTVVSGNGASFSLPFPNPAVGEGAPNVNCIFSNTPFPDLSLTKALGGPRDANTDQFTVQIRTGSATGPVVNPTTNSTTLGSGSTVTPGSGTTGIYTTTVGTTYYLTEAAAGTTNLANYAATITCTDSNGHQTGLPTDAPFSGSLAITPVASSSISCTLTNMAKPTPTVTTVVNDAATNAAWTGTETTGARAYDTATVTGGISPATGTVTYSYFTNGTCTLPVASTQTVTMSAGNVPNSSTTDALAAGSYSYEASYSGDTNNEPSTGVCEPFTVSKATPTTATVVNDAATNAPWTGTEMTGARAYDTATVSAVAGFTPTGTVTYSYFTNGTCTTPPDSTETVTMSAGSVPNSSTTAALAAGSYSFDAVYNGDANFGASAASVCEPFGVGKHAVTTATQVINQATGLPPTGSEVTGASFYDTATVGPEAGSIPVTGTVTYSYFTNGTCTVPTSSTQTVTISSGVPPNTSSTGPLVPGNYSYDAIYNGDSNYNASAVSSCEPFTVQRAPSLASTILFDATTNAAWSGTETTGATAYDTATVLGVSGFTPTGTVTYAYFTNGTCTAPSTSTQTVTMAAGDVPNSSTTAPLAVGSYSFDATYNGDSNYGPSPVSTCEPFAVAKANSSTATVVFDATTNAAWSGTEITGATAYDTSSVTGVAGVTPTGSVTYSYFTNGTCTAPPASTEDVTIVGGAVSNSATTARLAAGSYAFDAIYNGDSNYGPSAVSACEPFTVNKATALTITDLLDATTNAAWSGTETTGATAYDTSRVVVSDDGFTPTGTVTYSYFTNGSCDAPAGSTQIVTLAAGAVPNSDTTAPLAAGSYSYDAVFNGDSNDQASPVSACEPFTVGQAASAASTVLFDATTNTAWAGTEVSGATAYDTATVAGVAGVTPTGTLTYSYFTNGTCSAPSTSTQAVTLSANGTVPISTTTAALAAGSYSFDATYSGDANYSASPVSACEPFTVGQAASAASTVLFDATTNTAWAGTEVSGATAYDTATVAGVAGVTPTGTLTYSYFTNGTCSAPSTSTQAVTLSANGTVPNSTTTAALAAGSYSFDATYSGDANYSASLPSACEPFTVADVAAVVTPPTPSSPATPAATAPAPVATGPMAFTGADIAGMVATGLALLGLGGVLVLLTRRRRERQTG